ncbi:NAD-dependent epimerase/dehydratase family protein [Granulicella sp. 5B5]|uniref:NAD-dependent epimerase/dehydratase family protein n=1 Tax=Granulicella sp. 5B5 TaxID=1617967 RepID=UPI00177915A6|nr:NAD(P)-dependent oxidoreductase [Granulicella sp. 5B5]QMV19960.1 NAD-dependent epimerase/dehydratase family protein [Granulicella sp. 5B5]
MKETHTEGMPYKPLPDEDLANVIVQAAAAFEALKDARVLLTGGTGFFGHWLLESLLRANREMRLSVRVTVLTRDAARFRSESAWVADDAAITLLEGDVRNFQFPDGSFSHIVHAATDSGGQQSGRMDVELYDDILRGMQRVLDFAHASGVKRILYVSTGAVYGRSTQMLKTPENYLEQREVRLPEGSYEATKKAAEMLCLERSAFDSLECVIARPFAFVGPRLPLDAHFAIGNFLSAAMRNETIVVKGDGTPRRSWMYMSDLAAWLWTLLVRGEDGRAYNVGSEEAYSIREAAQITAETLAPGIGVEIQGVPAMGAAMNNYVPSVERARVELGLQVTVSLVEALRKTAQWYAAM